MHLYDIILSKYGMKKGIKMFAQDGVDAVISELQQLHTMNICEPLDPGELTSAQKYKAPEYFIFLKKKRCGKIKGCGCADGRKQRAYIGKEDTSYPTISIKALFLSYTIDATEGRDVATVDIPGALIRADMEGWVDMKLEGTMADLFTKMDSKLYVKHMRIERGKSILYVHLKKAMYGSVQ